MLGHRLAFLYNSRFCSVVGCSHPFFPFRPPGGKSFPWIRSPEHYANLLLVSLNPAHIPKKDPLFKLPSVIHIFCPDPNLSGETTILSDKKSRNSCFLGSHPYLLIWNHLTILTILCASGKLLLPWWVPSRIKSCLETVANYRRRLSFSLGS
jgi:hypothetical protein